MNVTDVNNRLASIQKETIVQACAASAAAYKTDPSLSF